MALMTTQQAAERLQVSVRHVQRLVADGDLVAIGTDRVDGDSVAQWLAQRAGSRVRAWEEPTAWAAVALLEGASAPWIGQAQRSRLRSTLVSLTAAELTARTRNRAEVHRLYAHPRALGRLSRDIVDAGTTRGVEGLSATKDRVDGYVDRSLLRRLVQRYRLESDPAGNVALRVTDVGMDVASDLARGGRRVLAGLDLAGSTDARERSAGQRILERALDRLRG